MRTRTLVALGAVIALSVAVGIIGAVVVLASLPRSVGTVTVDRATPTPVVFIQPKPAQGQINADGGGYAMTAREDGGDSWYLENGTAVQTLRTSGRLRQVQVMNGPHKNRVGWVEAGAVESH